ncbi:MAG TPA: histidine kinase dimerization/phosphoacceptor domain -containing protein [Azospirillaceae bacterium]|nr:histidine kinase dimerization/phosphoacceptor domain -containing protein [Azospirillaceae bacterium]
MLRLALDAGEMGEFLADFRTGRLERSARAERIFGLRPGEGGTGFAPVLARIHPEDVAGLRRTLRRARVQGARHSHEYRIRLPGGPVRWVRSQGEFLPGPDGRPTRLAGIVMDVTAGRDQAERDRAAEERLSGVLADMEVAVKEVNHRVKNSLQLVASLLALQAYSSADAKVREVLDEACCRVVTVARLHERLYRSDGPGTVPFDAYLADLCRDIAQTLGLDGRRRRLEVTAAPATLGIDQVVPLALIVNELVTNAAKHAFAPDAPGTVRVAFLRAGSSHVLAVEDDGPGLPPGFDADSAETMGLKTVRVLARQLGARLEIAPGPGARVSVVLKA